MKGRHPKTFTEAEIGRLNTPLARGVSPVSASGVMPKLSKESKSAEWQGRRGLFQQRLALELVVQGGLLCMGGLSSWLDLSILYINAQTGIP
jgi:hypothetical protein